MCTITNTKYENQFSNMKDSVYIGFLLLFPCLSNAASLGSHLEAKNPYLLNYNPQWSENAPAPALKYLPRVPLGLKMYSYLSAAYIIFCYSLYYIYCLYNL